MALAHRQPQTNEYLVEKSNFQTIPHFGNVSTIIHEARASLHFPSRPFTPAPSGKERAQRAPWEEWKDGLGGHERITVKAPGVALRGSPSHRPGIKRRITRVPATSTLPRRLTPLPPATLPSRSPSLISSTNEEDVVVLTASPNALPDTPCSPCQSPSSAISASPVLTNNTPGSSAPTTPEPSTKACLETDMPAECEQSLEIRAALRHLTRFSRRTMPESDSETVEKCENMRDEDPDHEPTRSLPTLFLRLYRALESVSWLRDNPPIPVAQQARNLREHVIRRILKWMDDAGDPEVAVAGCSLILNVTRHDRILANACKLLFKLSKNEVYDDCFIRYNVSAGLCAYVERISVTLLSQPTKLYGARASVLTYALGVLKNVTMDSAVAKSVVVENGVQNVSSVLQALMLLDLKEATDTQLTQAITLLVQATAVLRNLIVDQSWCLAFLVPLLCSPLVTPLELLLQTLSPSRGFQDTSDGMLNLSSVPSFHSSVPPTTGNLASSTVCQALMIRLCFILGNVTTVLSPIHAELRPHLSDLVAIFGEYASVGVGSSDLSDDSEAADGGQGTGNNLENEQVLIKLLRLLANLSLDPANGKIISHMMEIELAVDLLVCKASEEHEELILNIVGLLANLSFYVVADDDKDENHLLTRERDIAQLMTDLLLYPNPETTVEALRVLANLARRSAGVRNILAEVRGTEICTVLLDHSDANVVVHACGVLMNLMAPSPAFANPPAYSVHIERRCHDRHRAIVLEHNGVEKLIDCVENSLANERVDVATVAGQTLHNLCTLSTLRDASWSSERLEDVVEAMQAFADDYPENTDDPTSVSRLREVAARIDQELQIVRENVVTRSVATDVDVEDWDCPVAAE
ncbi:armadillo-type protein [Phlyctochytrium arcticum]|nr:armadillo-type protein [Phlyctochytrium arcticum]